MNVLKVLLHLFLMLILICLGVFVYAIRKAIPVDENYNEIKEENYGTEESNKITD